MRPLKIQSIPAARTIFPNFFDKVGVSRPTADPREPAAIASKSITQMGLVHFAAAND
jgi:hypothetical protein